MTNKSPTAVDNYLGMINHLDNIYQSDAKGQYRKEGAVESLYTGVVKGHENYDNIHTYDKKKAVTGTSAYNTNMTNKYRSGKSNLSSYTQKGYGMGWKPSKWNPNEEFPCNGFWLVLKGLYTRSLREGFRGLAQLEHLENVSESVNDLKIEDQMVENSNQEISYLDQKHEELQENLGNISTEIQTKKDNSDFNKQSDLAACVFLKAMNELREVEIQKNMIDYVVYKLNKDNWLSELVVAFHITNNNSAVESFSKEYVDKVFNRAYNIVWRRYFNEFSEKDFIQPKAKILECEDKSGKYLQTANDASAQIKSLTYELDKANEELKKAQKEEEVSKTSFSKNYNQFQAMINRFNSKKFQKSNTKPTVIRQQQTMIDRLEKELDVSVVKERELKSHISNIEEDMYRSKLEINNRKKTLIDLEDMERNALETGDKVEVERIKRIQNILKTASTVESNTRKLHNVKRNAFLRWNNAISDKKNKELLLGNVLLRATKNASCHRSKLLMVGWEAFRMSKMGLSGVKTVKSTGAVLEQRANLQAQIDSYNKDYHLKWFANNLIENYKNEPINSAALVNNTLKTKSFKEKLNILVNNLNSLQSQNEGLPKLLEYLFYTYDNNLQEHYNKVLNLNSFYKYFCDLIQELIRYRKSNSDGEFRYRILNLSSFLSVKDEAQLSMNKTILEALDGLKEVKKDSNLAAKIAELKELTYEDDGSLKGKLIMNVQQSVDDENMDVLKLPDDVVTKYDALSKDKKANKDKISKLKVQYEAVQDKRNKTLEKLNKLKSRLGGERGDIVGLRRKLERLRVQNEVLEKI